MRSLCLALLALAATAPLQGQSAPKRSASSHAALFRSCGAGLREYASFAEIDAPHDTLKMPSFSGTYPNAEAMRAARREAMASTGATGVVVETRVDMMPGTQATRTMSRMLPVFVPSDTSRVRRACQDAGTP